jgi:hypothetical protein
MADFVILQRRDVFIEAELAGALLIGLKEKTA